MKKYTLNYLNSTGCVCCMLPWQLPFHWLDNISIVLCCSIQIPRIILCMCPANERRCYNVTSSLIGWTHTQNDPWIQVCVTKLWIPHGTSHCAARVTKQCTIHAEETWFPDRVRFHWWCCPSQFKSDGNCVLMVLQFCLSGHSRLLQMSK